MKILGIDTATGISGVALMEDAYLLCDYRFQTGFYHSEVLLGLINRAFSDLKLTMDAVDGIALTVGPGSFTGLRVAVSTIKGILIGSGKPVIGSSTLRTMAETVSMSSYPICTMLDAKKGEVYAGRFEPDASGSMRRMMEDQVISPDSLLDQCSGETLFLGEGAIIYRPMIEDRLGSKALFRSESRQASMASTVARLGLHDLARGEGVDPEHLTPIYLRRSDAEVNLEKQLQKREAD